MPDPLLRRQDLIQSAPENINLGAKPIFRLNLYKNDGFGQPDQADPPTVNANTASCSIANVTDLDTEVDDPTVTVSSITNGYQLSFQVDTTASPFNAVGRFIATLTYDFDSETMVDYIFFNVVDKTNIFGSSS